MAELCDRLGIPRRTFNSWVEKDPHLAVYRENHSGRENGGGSYWVKIDRLVDKYGLDPVVAHTLETSRWMKATTFAGISGVPRRTIAYWCRTRPNLGRRIGRHWYIDLEALGATDEQIEALTLAARATLTRS